MEVYSRARASSLVWLLSSVVGLLGHYSAQAALTELDLDYYTDFPVITYVDGRPLSTYATSFTAERLNGTRGGATSDPLPIGYPDSFQAFCIDIRYPVRTTAYWESGVFPANEDGSRQPLWNEDGIYQAASLYQAFAGGVNPATFQGRLQGGALQLAIWDVLYGNGRSVNDRRSSFFTLGSANLINAANAMLASSANAPNFALTGGCWDAVYAADGTRSLDQNQDLIGPPIAIPEPGTFLAAGAAVLYLLGLGLFRIKLIRTRPELPVLQDC